MLNNTFVKTLYDLWSKFPTIDYWNFSDKYHSDHYVSLSQVTTLQTGQAARIVKLTYVTPNNARADVFIQLDSATAAIASNAIVMQYSDDNITWYNAKTYTLRDSLAAGTSTTGFTHTGMYAFLKSEVGRYARLNVAASLAAAVTVTITTSNI